MIASELRPTRPGEVRWPAERFYWSVLEAPGWSRSGPVPAGLLPELQDDLPLPLEELQVVCAPLGVDASGRIVVCAAAREQLASLGPDVTRLVPAAIPERIVSSDALASAATLNLLVGDFEPLVFQSQRWRRHVFSAAVVLLTAGLVCTGLVRRAQAWAAVSQQASMATTGLLAELGPGASPESVLAELLRLRPAAAGPSGPSSRPPQDAAPALAALLTAWPAKVSCKPQSITIGESSASISVLVEGDPSPFLSALKPAPGWTMEEPRLNRTDSLTRISVQLRVAQAAAPHTPGATP